MIDSNEKFVKFNSEGSVVFSGRLGDYLDSLIPIIQIQGAMGLQGIQGEQGEPGIGSVDISHFRAALSQPWAKGSAQIELGPFDTLVEDNNNPGFSVAQYSHDPDVSEGRELWMYQVAISLLGTADIGVFLTRDDLITGLGEIHATAVKDCHLTVPLIWQPGDDPIVVQVFTSGASDLVADVSTKTFWAGFRIGQVAGSIPGGGTFAQTITDGSNDSHQASDGSDNNPTAVTLKVEPSTTPSNRYTGGLRFDNPGISQGATIASAKISVVFPVGGRDSISAKIYGEKSTSSQDFVSGSDINSRPKTTAFVAWVGTDLGSGSYVDSPDIASVIQELVNQPTWSATSAITILVAADSVGGVEPTRFTPFENTPSDACKIEVIWS